MRTRTPSPRGTQLITDPEPVTIGHGDIEYGYIRPVFCRCAHRLASRACHLEHGQVRLRIEDSAQPGCEHRVIISEDQRDQLHLSSSMATAQR